MSIAAGMRGMSHFIPPKKATMPKKMRTIAQPADFLEFRCILKLLYFPRDGRLSG
jgi:hypothetical protein